jgi:hypothetical protein
LPGSWAGSCVRAPEEQAAERKINALAARAAALFGTGHPTGVLGKKAPPVSGAAFEGGHMCNISLIDRK